MWRANEIVHQTNETEPTSFVYNSSGLFRLFSDATDRFNVEFR